MKDMSELARAFDPDAPTVCSMEVPNRKELLETAMSAPGEA